MDKHYIHLKRAWYASANLRNAEHVDDVYLSVDGAEMSMKWYALDNNPVPRLEVFTGSWKALAQLPDVLARLSEVDGQNITPILFCAILDRCGFTDETPTDNPYEKKGV